MRARSLSEIRDRHLPGKISAGIPDSLAPELLQLLNSEFWILECGVRNTVKFQRSWRSQELQNETVAFRFLAAISLRETPEWSIAIFVPL